MDHCYARPAPVRSRRASSSSGSGATHGGAGGFDHDYTKPRTPPRAVLAPVNNTTFPAAVVDNKKPLALAAAFARKTAAAKLPSQPVKFAVRAVTDKFKILYKFLTDGIDLEDVMYLKRSYEMVRKYGFLIKKLSSR